MKPYYLKLMLVCLLFSSCATYSPPVVQHTYTTNTQSSHQLTGLNIIYQAGAETISDAVAQVGFLTLAKTKYYIDGRLICSHSPQNGLETFVQIPPGNHQLIVEGTSQGVITLGFKVSDYKKVYNFVLTDGQIGNFKSNSVSGEYTSGYHIEGFENVEHWKQISE